MKYILGIILLATLLYSDNLGWSHDYKKALVDAKKHHKLVYVLITSENCKWCRKFESTTLQDKTILKRLYKEFEVVHLSREKDSVPEKFKTSPIPRHYFLDADGKVLYNSLGHRKQACFDSFMDNAENKNAKVNQ